MSDRIVLYVQYLTLGLKEYGMGEIELSEVKVFTSIIFLTFSNPPLIYWEQSNYRKAGIRKFKKLF
jgi:hypothetical protein